MKTIALVFGAGVAALLTLAMLFTAGWVAPPILSTQMGFRGLAMSQLTTPAENGWSRRPTRCPIPSTRPRPTAIGRRRFIRT